jgi:hypothetical protein
MKQHTQTMYVEVHTKLLERSSDLYWVDLEPYIRTTDFEKSAINAFASFFPPAVISTAVNHSPMQG